MKPSNPTILLVDDDANDLLFIEAAFVAAGVTAKIRTVNGGDEAIAYLNGDGIYADRQLYGRPDFLVTDLKMPGIDGFSVLEHLSQHPELATIPAVVLSGSQDDDDIRKARGMGAYAYHVKPSSPQALRALIRTLVNYWMICELPEREFVPLPLKTEGRHKLGSRFARGER